MINESSDKPYDHQNAMYIVATKLSPDVLYNFQLLEPFHAPVPEGLRSAASSGLRFHNGESLLCYRNTISKCSQRNLTLPTSYTTGHSSAVSSVHKHTKEHCSTQKPSKITRIILGF